MRRPRRGPGEGGCSAGARARRAQQPALCLVRGTRALPRLPALEPSHAVRDALVGCAGSHAGPNPPAPEVSASGAVCNRSPGGCSANTAPRARARLVVTARGPVVPARPQLCLPRAAAAPEASRDPGASDTRASRGMPEKRVRSLQLASISPGLGSCRCAQERGLGRRNSGGRGSPAAITCSRPRGSTRRAASPAAAPDGPPPLRLSLRQRRRPAPRRPRPQATPTCAPRAPPPRPPRRRSLANGEPSREKWAGPSLGHAPFPSTGAALPHPVAPMVQLRAVARAGCRAKRGHWLPPRDPRWATVTHWFLPSIRWTPNDRDAPSTAHLFLAPLCVSVSPGRARRPGWSGRLCPSIGDPATSQHRPGMLRAQTSRGGTADSRWGMGMVGPNRRAVPAVSSG